MFLKLFNKIYLFDHHETAYDAGLNDFDNCTVRVKDDRGISQLGEEVIEREHNKITLGGILYMLKHKY